MKMDNAKLNSKGLTIWFTGLSGAGKSTLSKMLYQELLKRGLKTELLDSDIIRNHLGGKLGFSKEERDINVRHIGFICKLLSRNGIIAVAAAISPYRNTRREIRKKIGSFIEVYVKCPIEVLISRKSNFYKKALNGEIKQVAGIDHPYEEPLEPEITVETHKETPQESLKKITRALEDLNMI